MQEVQEEEEESEQVRQDESHSTGYRSTYQDKIQSVILGNIMEDTLLRNELRVDSVRKVTSRDYKCFNPDIAHSFQCKVSRVMNPFRKTQEDKRGDIGFNAE